MHRPTRFAIRSDAPCSCAYCRIAAESLLAVTNNRHCNGQFLQLAYVLCREGCPVRLDVIGCSPEEKITRVDEYDPYKYLQELIRILDRIERFDQLP